MCRALLHVDPTTQERQPTGAAEHEVEYQQDQQHQGSELEPYEITDQDLAYDYYDYTNSSSLQGKHRNILTQSLISVKSVLIYLCIKLIGIDLIPSCMR